MSDFDIVGDSAIADAVQVLGAWTPSMGDVVYGPTDTSDELVWRVRLSSDTARAAERVTAAVAEVESSWAAVGRVEGRLARLVPMQVNAGDVGRCRAFLDSAGAILNPRARVQTYVEARLIGWTVLPIVGRAETVVNPGADANSMQLHVRAVKLTVLSRATLMRLVLLIARSTARWSAAMATPLAPAAGVVAAWKIADDVMREEQWFRTRLQAAQSSTPSS